MSDQWRHLPEGRGHSSDEWPVSGRVKPRVEFVMGWCRGRIMVRC